MSRIDFLKIDSEIEKIKFMNEKMNIAVIGIGCLFPGAENPEEFWAQILKGADLTTFITKDDIGIDPEILYQNKIGIPDTIHSRKAGIIRNFRFDPSGYKLPAEKLEPMDRLFKWTLYTARQALADSGYSSNCSTALLKQGWTSSKPSISTASTASAATRSGKESERARGRKRDPSRHHHGERQRSPGDVCGRGHPR